jgi:hypothetical protein
MNALQTLAEKVKSMSEAEAELTLLAARCDNRKRIEAKAARQWRTDSRILNFGWWLRHFESLKCTPAKLKSLYESGQLKEHLDSMTLCSMESGDAPFNLFSASHTDCSSLLDRAFDAELNGWFGKQYRNYRRHYDFVQSELERLEMLLAA